eukprot:scaffold2003_cov420-Prasinococcus_capsulatus_cf.AAC.4
MSHTGDVKIEARGIELAELSKGSYVGEIGILLNRQRTATATVVSSVCDTFSLSAADVKTVIEEYPHIERTMRRIAMHRLADNLMARRNYCSSKGGGSGVSIATQREHQDSVFDDWALAIVAVLRDGARQAEHSSENDLEQLVHVHRMPRRYENQGSVHGLGVLPRLLGSIALLLQRSTQKSPADHRQTGSLPDVASDSLQGGSSASRRRLERMCHNEDARGGRSPPAKSCRNSRTLSQRAQAARSCSAGALRAATA